MGWQPGDVVALRHLNAGPVSYVWPMSVVADSPRVRKEWADVAAG